MIDGIREATNHVYRHLKPTPLYHYPSLSDLLGTETWVKHENHHPIGAFKVRGGINLASHLSEEEKARGFFTASTGNHGQSIAYAAMTFGMRATIAVPEGANPGKVAAMQGMGAEVLFHGPDFDTAREWVLELTEKKQGRFVGPTDEPLIYGVGTYALEIIEDLPETDVIIVPVGAGSGACGTGIVAKNQNKEIQVIAVQSAQAPAMQKSWSSGKMLEADMHTIAEGLATRVPFENTQVIMQEVVDEFLLVKDTEIQNAVKLYIQHTHNLAEEAGAAPLAAALAIKDQLKGKKVVLIMSGGNISLNNLATILTNN